MQFLKQILIKFKFGTAFCKMIEPICGPSKAQVSLNSYDSDLIMILRGTKQDCPLSPLLFNLTIEALVIAFRSNNEITRIKMWDKTYILNLFADNMILTLSNAAYLASYIKKDIEEFAVRTIRYYS